MDAVLVSTNVLESKPKSGLVVVWLTLSCRDLVSRRLGRAAEHANILPPDNIGILFSTTIIYG